MMIVNHSSRTLPLNLTPTIEGDGDDARTVQRSVMLAPFGTRNDVGELTDRCPVIEGDEDQPDVVCLIDRGDLRIEDDPAVKPVPAKAVAKAAPVDVQSVKPSNG